MARMRSGGGAAYAVALVVFVALFVFSLIVAILFYTQTSKFEVEARTADQKLSQFVTPNEASLPEVSVMLAEKGKGSVVAQLRDENSKLRQIISGSPNTTLDAIRAQNVAMGLKSEQYFQKEVQTLHANLDDANTRLAEANKLAKDAQDQMAASLQKSAVLEQSFNSSVKDLSAKLAELQGLNDAFRAKSGDASTALGKQLEDVRTQTKAEVTLLQGQLEQKDKEIATLKSHIQDIENKYKARQALGGGVLGMDGHIVTMLPDENLVYIDRGRTDRIVLGMTFEVFDRNTIIKLDEFGDLRGIATIEVIDIDANSATARIVRLDRGKTLSEGDPILNAVYDPHVSQKFYVFGEFDIDRTGQTSVTDRKRVETMVTQWGGQVADKLTYDTDFLVLGIEPKAPEAVPADADFDPVKMEQIAAQKKVYDQYESLINQARALSIPILNQNRFLSLVGYYQR